MVPNVGATAHRWAMKSSRGRWSIKMNLGGAKADHRPLKKINIYRKLQKNIRKIHWNTANFLQRRELKILNA